MFEALMLSHMACFNPPCQCTNDNAQRQPHRECCSVSSLLSLSVVAAKKLYTLLKAIGVRLFSAIARH